MKQNTFYRVVYCLSFLIILSNSAQAGFMKWLDKVGDTVSGNTERFELDDKTREFLKLLESGDADTMYQKAKDIYKTADRALDYCQINNLEEEDAIFRGTSSEMVCDHLRKKKEIAFDLLELSRDYNQTSDEKIYVSISNKAQEILNYPDF